jgi:hypothetical protein
MIVAKVGAENPLLTLRTLQVAIVFAVARSLVHGVGRCRTSG